MLVRLKYSKTGAGRFMSHLDLLRTMERVFRRAGLPLAFSEGFNPHPKVSYGSALAVGVTSDGEYLDVELREKLSIDEIKQRIDEAVPQGLKVLDIQETDEKNKSLTSEINMARYVVEIALEGPLEPEQIEIALTLVMAQPAYYINRRSKKGERQVDIIKGIYALTGYLESGRLILKMDLQTGSEGNVRPIEVVEMLKTAGNLALGDAVRIHRDGLFIRKGRDIKTPLEK